MERTIICLIYLVLKFAAARDNPKRTRQRIHLSMAAVIFTLPRIYDDERTFMIFLKAMIFHEPVFENDGITMSCIPPLRPTSTVFFLA